MNFSKKILTALLVAFTVFYSAMTVEAAKKVVAVMPLENISGTDTAKVAEIMTEELMVALQNSGRYSVLERNQMATILREQGFQNLTSDPNAAVEVGKLTGAEYSLIGKVTMVSIVKSDPVKDVLTSSGKEIFQDPDSQGDILAGVLIKGILNEKRKATVAVDIRFVNNETGELVFAKSFTGNAIDAKPDTTLLAACKDVAENFLKELTANLVGRVADTFNNDIYIDQGSESGLRVGDILAVVRETSPIEVNGKIVGMKTISIGKIQVTEINDEYSICKVVSLEYGMDIIKGDVIKRS